MMTMNRRIWNQPRSVLAFGWRRMQNPPMTMASTIALVGTGLVVGAALALLLAPQSGRETRHALSDRANRLGRQIRRALPYPQEKLQDNGSHYGYEREHEGQPVPGSSL
jgi:hypothetical protein